MVPERLTPLDSFVDSRAPICYGILKPGSHQPSGIPVIKVKNIVDGQILENKLLRTTEEIHRQYKRSEVQKGDLLLTIRGSTGRLAIVPRSLTGANITQDTARIRVSSDDDPMYLFYALQSPHVARQIELNTVGQAVKGINIAEVRKLKIYHPELEQQRKIAKILSTWDKAITTTEQLLANSEQQKKALMQQLLTGRKRLPGFEGKWQKVKVGELLSVRKEKMVPSEECPLYSLTIENGVTPKTERYNREFLVRDAETKLYKLVKPLDIVYNPANLRWGAINYNRRMSPVVVSPIYEVLHIKDGKISDLRFIAQVLMSSDQINRFASMVEGTLMERKAVKIQPFLATKIFFPPTLEEQQAIARILAQSDEQIELIQKKFSRLQEEKKSLMQQLLTGKRRVKVDKEEAETALA